MYIGIPTERSDQYRQRFSMEDGVKLTWDWMFDSSGLEPHLIDLVYLKHGNKRLVVGINAYDGDSADCIVSVVVLVAAVEEERFRRIKHWAGFPTMSVEFCLKAATLKLSDVDVLAFNSDPRANIFRKISYGLSSFRGTTAAVQKLMSRSDKTRAIEVAVREELGDQFRGKIIQVDTT